MKETMKPVPNQKLRYERERRGWSQQDVADKVGTTPLNVGRWERGITQPGPYFRQQLCQVFDRSLQELGLLPEEASSGKPAMQPSSTPPVVTPSMLSEPSAPLWNVPYHRNLFFTGREDILTQLREALVGGEQPIALAQPQAISGLGGIGKTQTAVEYAHRYRDEYSAVLWVRADSNETLISDFFLLAALLNLTERSEQDQSLIVKAVLHWFDTHHGWLLILDNADNLQVIEEFLPPSNKGHIVLTTRAHSTGTVAQRIELDKMSAGEGMIFLLRRVKRLKGNMLLESLPETLRSQAQTIVEALDGLPLALDQAGAYIEETDCGLSDYLKFYKTRRQRLLRARGQDAAGHPEPVATTWSLSFEKIQRSTPAAAELLRLCAFLQPDEIPEAMIIEGATELGPTLQALAEDELEWNEAIGELRRYSLMKRDAERKILNIHRLVQAVIKDGMDKETQRQWAERVVKMVNRASPNPEEIETWLLCQQYLPHVQVCRELVKHWNMTFAETSNLLSNAGQYLHARGQYNEAELFLTRALDIRESMLDAEHLDVATSLNKLSQLYYFQGKYAEAEALNHRALTIHEKALGPEHPTVANDLSDLAMYHSYQGKYEQVEDLYSRSLAIFEKNLGAKDTKVAAVLSSLGMFYSSQGRFAQAEPLLTQALKIDEEVLGLEHPDVANDLNNLSILYSMQGKYRQTEQLRRRVLDIVEKVLGPDHYYVALALYNLAALSIDLKKFEEGEPLAWRALNIVEKVLGPEHLETAYDLDCLSLIYRARGDYGQAEQFAQRSISTRETTLGPDNHLLANSLHTLALIYYDQGRYSEADALFQRIFTIREQHMGTEHPEVARTLNDWALLYTAQGRYREAEQLFQQALSLREKKLSPDHLHIAETLQNYASLLHKTGRESEAAALEQRLQAMRAKQE